MKLSFPNICFTLLRLDCLLILQIVSHLTVPTNHHLLSSEHDICGSLQTKQIGDVKFAYLLAKKKNYPEDCVSE